MRGLRARGAVGVDIHWAAGKAARVALRPHLKGEYKLRPPRGQQIAILLIGERPLRFTNGDDGVAIVSFQGGQEYELRFR